MQLIFERGHDTKVSTPAANSPKEIGLFVLARAENLAASGHEFDGLEVVEGKAILAHQPTQPATERKPRDPRAGDHPARDRQTMQLRLAIELGPGQASL